MSVIGLIVMLALIGVITWALVTYVPMPAGIKKLIVVVAVVACIIYVLGAFGILPALPSMRVPTVR